MIHKDGKEYARVSEILAPFSDFSHIDPQVLLNKCLIGTDVHEAISDDINGNFPVLQDKAHGYFASYCLWKQRICPEFIVSERRYFCEEKMITGCVDAVVNLPGNTILSLVDFKTSSSESPSWIMQAHLYAYLLAVNGTHVDTNYLFVKLCKYGGIPQVFQYKHDKNIRAKCFIAIDDFWKKASPSCI